MIIKKYSGGYCTNTPSVLSGDSSIFSDLNITVVRIET